MEPVAPLLQAIVALAWVRRRDGAALLVRRHDPALPAAHGRWELPGGKVAFGEHPAATVVREVREETGLHVSVGEPLPYLDSVVWDYPDRRQHVILLHFACHPGPHLHPASDPRVAEVAWLDPTSLDPATALPSVGRFLAWWHASPRT